MKADEVIRQLNLQPHPEGGHYREIHRDEPPGGGRGAVTTIYFLLRAGETSRWHRVDGTEIFHFHAGAPLSFSMSPDGRSVTTQTLGMDRADPNDLRRTGFGGLAGRDLEAIARAFAFLLF